MIKRYSHVSLLLVEDSESDVALIRTLLEEVEGGDFSVTECHYLRDAVEFLGHSTPEVVLLDLGLPDSEGLDAVKKLYASSPDTPLVVLTGNLNEQLAIDALRVGAQDYLVKGAIDADRLGRCVRYAIERKAAQVELNRLREDVAQLSNRQQQWVAQELHDGLGQHLTGLGMMAKSLQRKLQVDGSPYADFADEFASLIGEAQQIVRRLIRGLDPVDMSPGGLRQALQALANSTSQQCGIACRFDCADDLPVENHHLAVQLYRIAQEAVHNAVKHAATPTIELKLAQSDVELLVEVCDHGVGIQSDEARREGRGMLIMSYRASTVHGALECISAPNEGTIVRCRVPAIELARPVRNTTGNGE
ncbi:MAG: response regulator [Planctomycetales bacterium]|nr:response regulator [Planctomycetales bacterium]